MKRRYSHGSGAAAGTTQRCYLWAYTETCPALDAVKGKRSHPPHRSRNSRPARLPNLCSFFEETLGTKTELINPLQGLSHSLTEEQEKELSSMLGVAIGLALRSAAD